ncbi:MAG: hypothetical protein D9C04_00600 [Nitrosopumilus sp. B06]|nr:MAG: hypothetical protein EB828_04795 [Nitrosopumilus sp. D6]RNJ80653.1 MAG: hypothetical protein D9C04_00600 [Nitrosopumilus sp. B06]
MVKMKAATTEILVKSGDRFPLTGSYSYAKHVNNDNKNCYITSRAKIGIMQLKGGLALKLGSCPHEIYWKLEFTR